jgi:hypothetical protein
MSDLPIVHDDFVNPVLTFFREAFQTCPDPRFLYVPDSLDTKISIQGMDAFNLELVEKKPGITVEREDISWKNFSLDRLSGATSTGEWTYLDHQEGRLVCHCYAKTSLVSSHLASLVFHLIRASRLELRQQGGFFEIDSVNISRTTRYRGKDSSEPEFRSTAVTVRAVLPWSITQRKETGVTP